MPPSLLTHAFPSQASQAFDDERARLRTAGQLMFDEFRRRDQQLFCLPLLYGCSPEPSLFSGGTSGTQSCHDGSGEKSDWASQSLPAAAAAACGGLTAQSIPGPATPPPLVSPPIPRNKVGSQKHCCLLRRVARRRFPTTAAAQRRCAVCSLACVAVLLYAVPRCCAAPLLCCVTEKTYLLSCSSPD